LLNDIVYKFQLINYIQTGTPGSLIHLTCMGYHKKL
jgi:hypothetical protein